MASSTMINVPTTASRFALLQIDSDSDSEGKSTGKAGRDSSGKNRPGKTTAAGKTTQKNDQKKDKKKKMKDQQKCEVNELRSLAFKKIPQKPSSQPPTLQSVANVLLNPGLGDQGTPPPEGWQQWRQRDEQKTTDASSPKSRGKEGGGKKEKKKGQQGKDKKTVSLQNFQSDGAADNLGKKQEKEGSGAANVGPAQDERFFNKLEDDVSKIVQREKRQEQYSTSPAQEANNSTEHEPDPRAEQLMDDLEKKDQEIEKLKTTISQWEVKYKEVKARNAQLLKMLQQGEMKDKAEILLHVDELLNIKEELSSQVTLLHAALEQEKSKVKGLQTDQPKHQGNKRGKKGSECDL
ncbi:G kinase-anchoring protein 1 isoform X2 [Gadus morhua]|uniref:G kinase-anchoring protein 1 isoform X2 n=1 Tax=Gadus morhua TaxID=8049 RepID=UPI0011B74BCE|nr:G kinase-anchoring protein 1 isoform X2 [Gadus morhua]XP_059910008.1 G kinase-anchoring protein 1 isoform X2 [Gadus macrocephalus]